MRGILIFYGTVDELYAWQWSGFKGVGDGGFGLGASLAFSAHRAVCIWERGSTQGYKALF